MSHEDSSDSEDFDLDENIGLQNVDEYNEFIQTLDHQKKLPDMDGDEISDENLQFLSQHNLESFMENHSR